jgi:hypothetical protein
MQPRPTPRETTSGSADVATPASFFLASPGFVKDAVVQIETAMTLSPSYPTNNLGPLGIDLRRSGGIEADAAAFFPRRTSDEPDFG